MPMPSEHGQGPGVEVTRARIAGQSSVGQFDLLTWTKLADKALPCAGKS